jgi:hypothetical protein
MSKHEQHSGHSTTTAGKSDSCCGGAHGHECDSPEPASAGQEQKPAGHGSHAQAGDAGGTQVVRAAAVASTNSRPATWLARAAAPHIRLAALGWVVTNLKGDPNAGEAL